MQSTDCSMQVGSNMQAQLGNEKKNMFSTVQLYFNNVIDIHYHVVIYNRVILLSLKLLLLLLIIKKTLPCY